MTNFLLFVLYGVIMLYSSWSSNLVIFANGVYTGIMFCLMLVIIAEWIRKKMINN